MFSRVFCIGKGVKFAPFCLCKYGFLRVSFKMRNEKKTSPNQRYFKLEYFKIGDFSAWC